VTGYHLVRRFRLENDLSETGGKIRLPEGWKPFGVETFSSSTWIIARKWCPSGPRMSLGN